MSRTARQCVSTALVFATTVSTSYAAGAVKDEAVPVGLSVEMCAESFATELRRILRLELGDLLDERDASPSVRDSLLIRCEAQLIVVRARDAGAEQSVESNLRWDAFPGDAAPRAAALSAIELLGAIGPSLPRRIEARHARRPLSEPAPVTPKRVEPKPRPRTQLGAGAALRRFLAPPASMTVGARVELVRRLVSPFAVGVELEAAFARRRVERGELSVRSLSSAAWLGVRTGGDSLWGTLALGARFGVAELRGTPSASEVIGHQVLRTWGGPLLAARLEGASGPHVVGVAVETGFAFASAEGLSGTTPALLLGGGWLSGTLAYGVRF